MKIFILLKQLCPLHVSRIIATLFLFCFSLVALRAQSVIPGFGIVTTNVGGSTQVSINPTNALPVALVATVTNVVTTNLAIQVTIGGTNYWIPLAVAGHVSGGNPMFESTCIAPVSGDAYGAPGPFVATFTNAVAVGETVAVGYGCGTSIPTTVTDTRGNTYTLQASSPPDGSGYPAVYIYSTTVATAIQAGDSLTISSASAGYDNRSVCAVVLDNVTGVDVTANNSGNGTPGTVSVPGTTTQANDVIFACVLAYSCDYTGGNFTSLGASSPPAGCCYYAYDVLSATGAQDPGGSVGTYQQWNAAWVAFK